MSNLQISHTYFESFVRETEVSAEASKVRKNQLGKEKGCLSRQRMLMLDTWMHGTFREPEGQFGGDNGMRQG